MADLPGEFSAQKECGLLARAGRDEERCVVLHSKEAHERKSSTEKMEGASPATLP